jgi:hypothetical protein
MTPYLTHDLLHRLSLIHIEILLIVVGFPLLDRGQLHIVAEEVAQIVIIAA